MPRRKKSIIEKTEKMQDIEAVQALIQDMKPLLIKAGVNENHIKKIFNIEPDRHKELRHYLIELYIREYTLYKRAYTIIPEHAWKHYELVGITHQPEQIDLMDKAKALVKAWRERPKKKKIKKVINSNH